MCLLAAWHAKVLIVQLLDGRVVMGLPVGHGSVQIIQGFRTGCFHIHSSAHVRGLDRLAAAVYAAAGASHDLNELIVCLAVFHTVKQRLGVAKAGSDCHADLHACHIVLSFLDACGSTNGLEIHMLQCLAGQCLHCGTESCLHNAAGSAEDDACAGGLTQRMIEGAILQIGEA